MQSSFNSDANSAITGAYNPETGALKVEGGVAGGGAGTEYVRGTTAQGGESGPLLLGIDADGNYHPLGINEVDRLKVSTLPGDIPLVSGDITAVQAAIGTPVVGGTVECDVSRASNLNIFCSGTFSAVTCLFEGSLESTGDTNWFAIQGVRTNANTIELTTGALSAQPGYAWELSVNALSRFRVRCTVRTSGTQTWKFKLGSYATEPIPAAQVTASQAVTMTSTTVAAPAVTIAGLTIGKILSAASTNATAQKGSAARLIGWDVANTTAGYKFLKFYNKATAPVVGTDVPVYTVAIPPNGTVVYSEAIPISFATGLAYAITGAYADADTTVVAAGDVIGALLYV